jgi:hypothetical protein
MRVLLPEALTVDPDIIALPDYSFLDVETLGTILIPFSDIHIDGVTQSTEEEVEALAISFSSGGIITEELPPAVVRQPEGSEKPYKLVYGYARCESLQELLQQSWFFTLLEGSEDALIDVRTFEGERSPKRVNTENDMKNYLVDQILRGKIDNNEDAIRWRFKKVYPNRGKEVCARVIEMVTLAAQTPQDFILYPTIARIEQWVENHSDSNYKVDGGFDVSRNMYGVVCKEGQQSSTVLQAVKRFRDSGKRTYVIGHFGPIKKRGTIESLREKYVQEFDNIRESLEHAGLTEWPIQILGYLPQVSDTEPLSSLVDPVTV